MSALLPPALLTKLEGLPQSPGVYLFRDKAGTVVYVGKAKSLKARVRSYFQEGSSDTRYFIPLLHRVIGDLDTLVTSSEKEALLLENQLIKEHRPRFNVKLRDDKTYLSLRLALNADWARLEVVRRPHADGARYFGPYHSASSARRTLHLINKHFQLRTCTDSEFSARTRPCLQHQIKRCPAPCVYEVDAQWYGEQAKNVAMFLDGKHETLSTLLAERMETAAVHMRFELAAVYRDQLRAIEKVQETQRVSEVDDRDRDVLGLYREADLAEIAVVYVRRGRVADVATYTVKNAATLDEEIVSAFLAAHYTPADDDDPDAGVVPIPEEILLPCEVEGVAGIAEYLADVRGSKVELLHPMRGKKVALVELANENALHAFREKRRAADDIDERLAQLKEKLRLPTYPLRIECCDISHLGGGDTVGAVVAMLRGEPDKKRYRSFHVRGTGRVHEGGDDYGAMYEVLARRFRRGLRAREAGQGVVAADKSADDETLLIEEDGNTDELQSGSADATGDSAWDLPDLFVVDGGRGQLGVALAAARDLGLFDLPIVGLAKEKENVAGEQLVDRVYLAGQKNPIPVRSSSALMILARARDEAHRFSNKVRERIGLKSRFSSELDTIPGVGPKTKRALLGALGSLERIRTASDADLLAVVGVTRKQVAALRAYFGPVALLPENPRPAT